MRDSQMFPDPQVGSKVVIVRTSPHIDRTTHAEYTFNNGREGVVLQMADFRRGRDYFKVSYIAAGDERRNEWFHRFQLQVIER